METSKNKDVIKMGVNIKEIMEIACNCTKDVNKHDLVREVVVETIVILQTKNILDMVCCKDDKKLAGIVIVTPKT